MARHQRNVRVGEERLIAQVLQIVRERGPLTVAAFMDLVLYHPELGYYPRAAQRSGRSGDFFTSVDVGPLFGQLIEIQLAEMFRLLRASSPSSVLGSPSSVLGSPSSVLGSPSSVLGSPSAAGFDLVEVGAGSGRLSADILRAARDRDPDFYAAIRLHLVEASARAREAQRETLGDVAERLHTSSASLPESFEGVLVANELLDAMPVHQVVMREDGLREVYVVCDTAGSANGLSPAAPALADRTHADRASADRTAEARAHADHTPTDHTPASRADTSAPASRASATAPALRTIEGPPSTPALQAYLDRLGVVLEPGWRVEINLAAVDWIREAARRLRRGFLILVDYGHPARELYSASHSSGTLTTFSGHRSRGPESADAVPAWLQQPGEQDITAHVDFTSIRAAAEDAGLTTLGFLDQTYFLLGLVPHLAGDIQHPAPVHPAPAHPAPRHQHPSPITHHQAPALKTLVMPGGLGSTQKVLILGKNVGAPPLAGCSFKVRVT